MYTVLPLTFYKYKLIFRIIKDFHPPIFVLLTNFNKREELDTAWKACPNGIVSVGHWHIFVL